MGLPRWWVNVSYYRNFRNTDSKNNLLINMFALSNCLSYRKAFPIGINTLSKMVLKNIAQKVRLVWTIRFCSNFSSKRYIFWKNVCTILSFLTKKKNHDFWLRIDAILQDVSATETIVWCWIINLKTIKFHCSKKYGIPTRSCNQIKSCI